MEYSKRCIVTGAAGFIGSALARLLLKETGATVLVVDKLTYAGVPESLKEVGLDPDTLTSSNPRLGFLKADICDQVAMDAAFADFKPDTIFHLAAESHVDRSIDGPGEFIRTNVTGTATLLQAALNYWKGLDADAKAAFRFQHISTDEVYGTLGETGYFTEKTPYSPHSPYSASKASSNIDYLEGNLVEFSIDDNTFTTDEIYIDDAGKPVTLFCICGAYGANLQYDNVKVSVVPEPAALALLALLGLFLKRR